jgi:hypothetical protein
MDCIHKYTLINLTGFCHIDNFDGSESECQRVLTFSCMLLGNWNILNFYIVLLNKYLEF